MLSLVRNWAVCGSARSATHSSMILKMFSNKKVIICDDDDGDDDDDDNYDNDN